MNLPINQATIYSISIPSSGKKVKFRQFLVKEQKALLLAQQSNDEEVMYDTLKNVIKNCVIDPIDIDKLALFDIEYLFVALRTKSVGEMAELIVGCPDCKDDKAKVNVTIDLEKIQIEKDPDHTNKIHLFDDVGIVMKYPSLQTVKILRSSNMADPNQAINVVLDCIDYIYKTDEIFKADEAPKEKMIEFIDNLSEKQMKDIKKFFKTMPKLYNDIEYTCPVCGKTHKKRLEGLASFF